jgi:glycosyltransferase involved in cell wall biosynthesis
LNIVHVIPGVGPSSFGGGSAAYLVSEQVSQGHAAALWSLDNETDRQWAAASSGLSVENIRGFEISAPKAFRWSREMEREAHREAGRISIVHQHALWTGLSCITSMLRDRYGIPTVVTPHGALEKWAFRKSRWKKAIALALYEGDNLRKASCLYACSEQELAGFREFGLKNPVAVLPNGITKSWLDGSGNKDAFLKQFNLPSHKRILLFLSRITPVKGLAMLMESLHMVRNQLAGWLMVIAGSDEFNHKAEIVKRIHQLHLEDFVFFTGPLFDQVKRDAFAAADIFVLPTKRENFGNVVVESLGAGVPIITTKGTPWEKLVTYRCGWWVDVDANAIAEALKAALSSTPDELKRMGQRGKELAAKYSWNNSARMTIELYNWLLGRRERPEFVITE